MNKLTAKLAKGMAVGKLSALKALKKTPAQIEKEEIAAKHKQECD